mgnify:CR=1 FL=1
MPKRNIIMKKILKFITLLALFSISRSSMAQNPCGGTGYVKQVCFPCMGTGVFYGILCGSCGGYGYVSMACSYCANRKAYELGRKQRELYEQSRKNSDRDNTYYNNSNSSSYSNNSSSSSVYTTCRICRGSGICTSCNGTGGYYVESGMYTGSDSRKWCDCPSCHGNKRCFNCYGSGRQ